jgi:hypothetical protein
MIDRKWLRLRRNPLISRCLPPIAQRLGDLDSADLAGAGEVGDGAGDAQDALKASGGQAHRGCRVGEGLSTWFVGGSDAVEKLAVGLRVRARAGAVAAVRLNLTGARDTAGDFSAPFGR